MKYHVVVGLEMHCEMKSTTKVYSLGLNEYSKEPNININEVDLGFPGIMPFVNMECVKKALMASLILKCTVPDVLIFDRKNYYYPDLPKGYQITQNTKPIGIHGSVDIEVDGIVKTVSIQDIHLEEDTASLDHMDMFTLIDYNRCGVPLLECVTDPCLYSSDEAVAWINTMCRIYKYTGISDADTKKGEVRCDVNVNLQDENGKFVTPKVEMKNLNSIANIKAAIDYEAKRQLEALENGDVLEQETRRFDEESGTTIHARSKEDAEDYKYFVEPNIPPFRITEDLINEVKKDIPVLALERKLKYQNEYGLDDKTAKVLVKEREISDYFDKCVSIGIEPKTASNWITGSIASYIYKEEISINDFYLIPEYLKEIIDKVNDKTISSKQAKEIFAKSLEDKKEPKEYITSGSMQVSDEGEIEGIIDEILNRSQTQIDAYHNGKTNLFDYFVGQVMKETRGKANPEITKNILHNKLDK